MFKSVEKVFKTPDGMYHAQIVLTLESYTAQKIENAYRASFYGIHSATPEAVSARRAIKEDIVPYLDKAFPSWTAYIVARAKVSEKTALGTPARAEILVTVDYPCK